MDRSQVCTLCTVSWLDCGRANTFRAAHAQSADCVLCMYHSCAIHVCVVIGGVYMIIDNSVYIIVSCCQYIVHKIYVLQTLAVACHTRFI